MVEEDTKEFPSFRKVYKYRGGFEKFVYDKLKELMGSDESEENSSSSDEPPANPKENDKNS